MNILLTSGGRRNYLVHYFREALAGRGRVFVADASADASALQEADQAFVVPPASDRSYIDHVLHICQKHGVRLLCSLNDLELPVLAQHRNSFLENGTIPVVSSLKVVETCFDKWATNHFLRKIGLTPPRTYVTLGEARSGLAGDLSFPLVIKPRWGTASIGIEYPEDMEELEVTYRLATIRLMRSFLAGVSSKDWDRCVLIQERLGGEEFGLDIVNDLSGRYVTTFVKRKLAMRAGETDKAVTVAHEALEAIGKRIGKTLGHVGNLDCDVFVSGTDCYVLEMNPRFGGGYPFSHEAGANLPAAMIAWAKGEIPDPKWLAIESGVASAKCDSLVVIKIVDP